MWLPITASSPHFSPMSPRPPGTQPTGLTARDYLRGSAQALLVPGQADFFLLVFSTLQSSLTVFPSWVNTAPVHTSITGFVPRAAGGSSLDTARQFSTSPHPLAFVLGLSRQAEEEQKVLRPPHPTSTGTNRSLCRAQLLHTPSSPSCLVEGNRSPKAGPGSPSSLSKRKRQGFRGGRG